MELYLHSHISLRAVLKEKCYVIYLHTLNEVRVKLHNICEKLLCKNRLFLNLNLSMFRAVRQVTVYVPATALQLDIAI
jgi:hypothetical protein